MERTDLNRTGLICASLFLSVAILGFALEGNPVSLAQFADTIDLEDFRWTSFPLDVFVSKNEWSRADYAVAVREAVDAWMGSVWEYISTYNDSTLSMVNYYFYLEGVNSTGDYDVAVYFEQNELTTADAVGLTTTRWNPASHEPLPPIVINITTYSATASKLFVKDVAMHEFGHALGLGHASSSTTADGQPELMHSTLARNEVVYPSTLDVYGLIVLYKGGFGQTVELPSNIDYKMLIDGNPPPPPPLTITNLLELLRRYVFIIALVVILVVAVLLAARAAMKKEKPVERPAENEPPTLPDFDFRTFFFCHLELDLSL